MGLTKPPVLEWRRLPVLGLSIVALLAGLTGALVLLGVPMPAGTLPLAATHGVLMTLGFLGLPDTCAGSAEEKDLTVGPRRGLEPRRRCWLVLEGGNHCAIREG